jgi:hypothetical protein
LTWFENKWKECLNLNSTKPSPISKDPLLL